MRLASRIFCFFVVLLHNVYCFPNLWRGLAGRGLGEVQRQERTIEQEVSTTDDKEVKLPEKLFTTDLAPSRNSFCHQARKEFGKLCGLRSALDKMKLASLVTNCHLEVSGRPGFEWDPVKKLGDAGNDYVHLVMQFLPLMSDVCQKAGYNPFLAQLVADSKSADDLRDRIIELQDATERLFEANRESSEFVRDYKSASADASKKLTEILKLSAAIKDANDAIDFERESLRQEGNRIRNELREFNKHSLSLFDSVFGRFDGFQSQISNMADTVGQIHSDSRVTSMFLKEPLQAISNTSVTEFSETNVMSENQSSPFLSFRNLGFLKTLVLGPLKLSERIHKMESSAFLGPFVKDVFSSVQLLLVLLSIYIAYIMLTTFTRVLEAVIHFAAVLKPSQPFLVRLARFFGKSEKHQARPQSLDMEQLTLQRLSADISKALTSASVTEAFATIVRKDDTDRNINLLFARISEIDMRLVQISKDVHFLHHVMQPISHEDGEKRVSCSGEAISAFKNASASESRVNSVSLATDKIFDSRGSGLKHQTIAELTEVTTSTVKDSLQYEASFRAQSESGSGDQGSNRSSQKPATKPPRRELKRRRSSRRKA